LLIQTEADCGMYVCQILTGNIFYDKNTYGNI
jgi:hypothetical protein